MSKNNYNQKTPWLTITIIVLVVLGLGYFLVKSSPQNTNQTAAQLNALVGKPMPNIQLVDKDGKTYTSADFKSNYTVLFFNEGLMCYPACWDQMASFGSDQRFNSDQIQAISVITDSARDWQTAIAKMPGLAKATTLFDTGAGASRQLGMLTTNSSMHRGSLPGHTYIVVGKDGVVRYVFDDPNMAIANDMLFNKIQELSKQ